MLEEDERTQPDRVSDRGEELDVEHVVAGEPTENPTGPEATPRDLSDGTFPQWFVDAAFEPTRLAILWEVDGQFASVAKVAARLGVREDEAEDHIGVLLRTGLVSRAEDGRIRSRRSGWRRFIAELDAMAERLEQGRLAPWETIAVSRRRRWHPRCNCVRVLAV